MRLTRVVLLFACLASAAPALADAPAPRQDATRAEGTRRTGRLPARIEVAPASAAKPPVHVVMTIPRDHLKRLLASGGSDAVGQPSPDLAFAAQSSSPLRHYVAAAALTLAVLSLPLLAGRLRRGRALALALLALLAGVALVRADIAAPPTGPQTVEVIIVPGNGPVQVRLAYPPRP